MAATLRDTLLEKTSATITRRSWRTGLVTAALLLSASFVGYNVLDLDANTLRAQLSSHVTGNQTELETLKDFQSPSCYRFTGGGCHCSAASKGRWCQTLYQATGSARLCSCDKCVGADGVCQSETNTKVNKEPFTLKNKQNSWHWLYMPALAVLNRFKLSASPGWTFGGGQYFDLYEMPGLLKGKKQYFLSLTKWPEMEAAMYMQDPAEGKELFGVKFTTLFGQGFVMRPQDLSVHVCSLKKKGYSAEVMFGNDAPEYAHTAWAYSKSGTWFVYGWEDAQDPGESGYWTVSDPSFIAGLDDC